MIYTPYMDSLWVWKQHPLNQIIRAPKEIPSHSYTTRPTANASFRGCRENMGTWDDTTNTHLPCAFKKSGLQLSSVHRSPKDSQGTVLIVTLQGWAATGYIWGYNSYRWPHKWAVAVLKSLYHYNGRKPNPYPICSPKIKIIWLCYMNDYLILAIIYVKWRCIQKKSYMGAIWQ